MKTFLTTILCGLMLAGVSHGATTISALPAKASVADADPFIIDDIAGNATKKLLWSTIKTQLQAASLFQPLDSDLTALAAIGTALTNGLAAEAWASARFQSTNANLTALQSVGAALTNGLESIAGAAATYQPLDINLTTLSSAGRVIQGTVGNGVTDDTAAFKAAMDAGGIWYVPPGTYLLTNLTTTSADVTLIGLGNPILKYKLGTNGTMVAVAGKLVMEGFKLDGQEPFNYSTYLTPQSNRVAIACNYQSQLRNLDIRGFSSIGIQVNGFADSDFPSGMSDGARILNSVLVSNWCGIEINAEYTHVIGTESSRANYGFVVKAGNSDFSGSSAIRCFYGLHVYDGFGNPGHGSFSGGMLNHDDVPLWMRGLNLGYTIVGSQIMGGGYVNLQTNIGVHIVACQLDPTQIICNGGTNSFTGNYFRYGAVPTGFTGSPTIYWRGNFAADGAAFTNVLCVDYDARANVGYMTNSVYLHLAASTAYGAGWDGSTLVADQNAVYDKIQAMSGASGDMVYVNAVRAPNPNFQTNSQIHMEYGGTGGTNVITRIADGAPITNANLFGTTSITTMNAGDVVFTNPVTRLNFISGAGSSGVVTNGLTNLTLTATRVPFVGAGKQFTDDADLTFATDTLNATKITAPTSITTAAAALATSTLGTVTQTNNTTYIDHALTAAAATNFVVDFGYPVHTLQATGNVNFQQSTGRVAAGLTRFTTVTIISSGSHTFTYNAGWHLQGTNVTSGAAGNRTTFAFMNNGGTSETNVVYGASQGP